MTGIVEAMTLFEALGARPDIARTRALKTGAPD